MNPPRSATPPNAQRRRRGRLLAVGALLILSLMGYLASQWLRNPFPRHLLEDIRAGRAARAIQDPDQRLRAYLTLRYGPLSDPENRRRVFLDFFDVDRIRALQFLVQHAPQDRRQESIDAMSRWVAAYRTSLTPNERQLLNSRLEGAEGQALLRRATAQYNAQDVQYRGQTAGVISELLKTIGEIEGNPTGLEAPLP